MQAALSAGRGGQGVVIIPFKSDKWFIDAVPDLKKKKMMLAEAEKVESYKTQRKEEI